MNKHIKYSAISLPFGAALFFGQALASQEPESAPKRAEVASDAELVACIDPDLITQIEVESDWVVHFRMRGGRVMQNVMPNQCRSLYEAGAFTYRTRKFKLCEGSEIRYSPYSSQSARPLRCELGPFKQIAAGIVDEEDETQGEQAD